MKVADVMRKDYKTIDKDQMLIDALELMRKDKATTRVIVVDDDKPVGIISFRDVADRLGTHKTDGRSPTSLRVSSAMTYPFIKTTPDESLEQAAKTMIDKRISSLVVMDGEELLGLLTKFDLLKAFESCQTIKVKDLMTKNPLKISQSERIISARKIMMDNKFSVIPIGDNKGALVGIVDDETIADALAKFRESVPIKHQKHKLKEYYVGQVMKTDPAFIHQDSPMCDIINMFEETLSKGILVKNDAERIVGILTVTDITKSLAAGDY
jgi:CBS domain-containing protein